MNIELDEKQLEAVTGGNTSVPSCSPVKFRCVKCGYVYVADGALIPKVLRCTRCNGPLAKVRDE